MPSWACCGENRVFSFRRGCGFKYTILEGMALSFCQSVNTGYGKGKKQGTLSKKYPLYGKSRTDDVMKTPS